MAHIGWGRVFRRHDISSLPRLWPRWYSWSAPGKNLPVQPFRSWIPVFVLVCASLPVLAQNAGAGADVAILQVTLGNATVPLDGLWKFHTGDSPQANGASAPRWAQPEFDDSAWSTMDLTPPPGSFDAMLGSSGFVPGWTARGYKGISGYAWYRLRVNIQDGQSALALKMPNDFDDAYQVYVNGQRIGEFGRFTPRGITLYNAQPRAFPLPANLHSGPATRKGNTRLRRIEYLECRPNSSMGL
jgi:hypothetical protein